MNYLYENMQEGDFQNLNTAARYQEELERQDFYLIDTKIEQVATGLGLLANRFKTDPLHKMKRRSK